jgi:hypothetical protein
MADVVYTEGGAYQNAEAGVCYQYVHVAILVYFELKIIWACRKRTTNTKEQLRHKPHIYAEKTVLESKHNGENKKIESSIKTQKTLAALVDSSILHPNHSNSRAKK